MHPMREVTESRLSNGLRIISEEMKESSSTSIGIWVNVGSRDEIMKYHGCTHFLEHLLFKGTSNRSAKEISKAIEERGGYLNAFTDRDMTCFHAKVLGKDLKLALEVLSDLVQNPLLKQEDVEKERIVVLSEIDSRDDDPGDLIHDLYFESIWGENEAAHPILGERASLNCLTNESIRNYFERYYMPSRMIVTGAGDLKHEDFVAIVEKNLTKNKNFIEAKKREEPKFKPVKRHIKRKTNQVQLALTSKGLAYNDPQRDALNLISSYLGVGASSKLFQEIREKYGLVYSIFSTGYSLSDAGVFAILAGTQDKYVEKILKIELRELIALSGDLSERVLQKIKHKTTGLFVLSSESSESRMMQLGVSSLRQGKPKTLEEAINGINSVKLGSIKELAEDIFAIDRLGLTTLGLSKSTVKKLDNLF
jgi:predicted Zn-dependent peptidase